METLIDLLKDSATQYGHQTALSTRRGLREDIWTYRRLWQCAQAIAEHLTNNECLTPGDRVLASGPNSPELVAVYFGTMLARLILVPLDPSSTFEFIRRVADKTQASAIITGGQIYNVRGLRSIPLASLPLDGSASAKRNEAPSPDDTAEVVFTSGTTGNPKGVVLTHRNIVANVLSAAAIIPNKRDYRFLSLLPLSHMLEQTVGLYLPLYCGASIYYPACRRSSVIFKIVRRKRISSMVVVPQVLKVMIEAIERKALCRRWQYAQRLADLLPMAMRRCLFSKVHRCLGGKLDVFICGGAPLPTQVAQRWEQLGVKVVEGYGATECAPIVAGNTLRDRFPGSVGRPVSGVRVQLTDQGEILVKGNNVTQGYWQDRHLTEAAFTPDGWYRTGDLAEVSESGRLYLKGRLNERIVLSSGLNVYPEDVERILNEEDSVLDCVVFGRSDDEGNVTLGAAIRPADPDRATAQINRDFETAVRSANMRLAPHQRIAEFTIWEDKDFPRTNLLKVKRHEVRAFLSDGKRNSAINRSCSTERNTLAQIQGILLRLTNLDPDEISPASDLDLDLGLDSLSRVELIVQIEDKLGVELDETEIENIRTVQQLVELVEQTGFHSKAFPFPVWSLGATAQCLRTVIQWTAIFPLHRLFCRPFKIEGRENLEKLKLPALFIANHNSHADTPLILRALPEHIRRKLAVAAATDYFFRNQVLSVLAPLVLNAFPLSRKGAVRAGLEYCGDLMDAGWSILIYPEGTRSTTGHLRSFKKGIGLLATELRVPVVPIGVQGGFQILPKGHRVPKPGPVKVRFGPPIEVPKDADNVSVLSFLENAVVNLLGDHDSDGTSLAAKRHEDLPATGIQWRNDHEPPGNGASRSPSN